MCNGFTLPNGTEILQEVFCVSLKSIWKGDSKNLHCSEVGSNGRLSN